MISSFRALALALLGSTGLAGYATFKPPEIDYDNPPQGAALQAEPPKPIKVVEIPKPLPLPGQLKAVPRCEQSNTGTR